MRRASAGGLAACGADSRCDMLLPSVPSITMLAYAASCSLWRCGGGLRGLQLSLRVHNLREKPRQRAPRRVATRNARRSRAHASGRRSRSARAVNVAKHDTRCCSGRTSRCFSVIFASSPFSAAASRSLRAAGRVSGVYAARGAANPTRRGVARAARGPAARRAARAARLSPEMYSRRLVTLARASTRSWRTSTGPTSLNTPASGSSRSSSCTPRQRTPRRRARRASGARGPPGAALRATGRGAWLAP